MQKQCVKETVKAPMTEDPTKMVNLSIGGVWPGVNKAQMNVTVENTSSNYVLNVYGQMTAGGKKFGDFGVNLDPGEKVNLGRNAKFDLKQHTDVQFCTELTKVEIGRKV